MRKIDSLFKFVFHIFIMANYLLEKYVFDGFDLNDIALMLLLISGLIYFCSEDKLND